MVGPSRLQGPHHSAQKSTRTGCAALMTDWSKFVSVSVVTFSDAIFALPLGDRFEASTPCRSAPQCRRPGGHIHFDILAGRNVPRVIIPHARLLHLSPLPWVPVELQRPVNSLEETRGAEIPKFEPVRSRFREVPHRVFQPASRMDDGQRAVSEAV